MNKKLAMLGVGVAVGSMMLVTSVYAGVGDAPGYETFKSAVKQTAAVKNVTRQVNVSVQDNGASLLQVNTTIKNSGEEHAGSAELKVVSGTDVQTIQFYSQDGKQIVKTANSDVYKILQTKESRAKFKKHDMSEGGANPQIASEVEHVVDALVGNLKNNITMVDAPGDGKEIHFKLSGSQIPPVVKTVGSLVLKHGAANGKIQQPAANPASALGIDLNTLRNSFPQLASDISLDEVEVNANVDGDQHITSQMAQIHVSGKDTQGVEHDIVLRVGMTLSSLNATTPDTIDLNGKQVETVNLEELSKQKGWGGKHE
ncbi:hypothetical protein [Paenibacillus roseipurpureus]|uniref:DUF4179 domain-containing protein n=1 Tax=Paenibacillus roseopurpureus TaxID=2918901 RepID=A0AA96LMM2_9BACL|nr:hypothetical protein [Paenibacillus sp. MBLB1832]WNR43951.1 hypothetical protein MJB10_23095 [Paenibacillus sp. MBLB1832]